MKTERMIKLILAMSVLFFTMVGATEAKADTHEHYFPLNVGNSWTYVSSDDGSTRTFTIIGTQEINGHTYYKFDDYVSVCGFPGYEGYPPEDSNTLFRYDQCSDTVLQYWPSQNEDVVRYDFSQNMWGMGNQLIQKGHSCMVPAGTFDNCCTFEFGMLVDCGEFYETLAPDVGNIAFHTSWIGSFELQSYTIVPEPAMVYHVDGATGDNTNDGLTRETAFKTIQWAIDEANDCDTVLVWPGVYNETATHGINFNGKAITVKSAADAAILEVPGFVAVIFVQGEDANSVLSNFVVRGSLIGIFALFANPTINNVTVVDNDNGVIADNADPHITNSIFWNNTNGDLFTPLQAKYSCIEEGGEGQGNISIEPLFADANNGDYHLLSERGRYWPAHDVWVLDKVTSSCVDGGDPTVDPANEPMPNGGRINMGAYGNSAYASMSEWPLEHDSNRDGKVNMLDFAKMAQEWLQTLPWAAPPQISITSPSEGALITYNTIDPILVEAEASGSVVKVEFFANGSKIGQDNNGLDGWDISWHPDSDGGFALTATATTQVGLQTTSTVVNVTVAYVW